MGRTERVRYSPNLYFVAYLCSLKCFPLIFINNSQQELEESGHEFLSSSLSQKTYTDFYLTLLKKKQNEMNLQHLQIRA